MDKHMVQIQVLIQVGALEGVFVDGWTRICVV